MGLNLLSRRLLVLRDTESGITAGGIILPDQLIEERSSGTVILIGNEVDKKFEGKHIIFQKLGTQHLDHNGVPHVVLYQSDIVAIN